MDDRRGALAAAAGLTARSGWGALEHGGVVAADDLGDQLLAAMLPPSTMPRPGEQLTLAIDLAELHLFDEAGRRLAG
jgi:hypothetical protein